MRWPLLNRMDEVVAFTQIDEADIELVSQHRWGLQPGGYAGRTGTNGTVLLHRLISSPPKHLVVDHINRDPLDNRRSNLRFATRAQNMHNSMVAVGRNPRRGVCWAKREGKWLVRIEINKQKKHIGTYRELEDAINAREEAERKFYGEFAPRIDLCST